MKTISDLENREFQNLYQLREKLYEQPTLFDDFIQNQLSNTRDIETVQDWRNKYIRGRFYLFRLLKKHAIFLSTDEPSKAYGVIAITTPFEEMSISSSLPTLVETVLLPLEQKIVADGFIKGGNLMFGSGIRKSINTSYEEAKARFGIITSLNTPIQETESADAAKLRAYLKNQHNREEYWYEIQEIKEKSPELKRIYAEEMGKAYGKIHSKRWREIGLKDIWVAQFEEMPIATGKTKAAVEKVVKEILPSSQQEFVYIFQLKGK
ncbi:hypothetical protein K9N68_32965 [Kovacikia minuta CCNUW1]|uniref:hypothetical protein n=1 Tax=Kovacikia minuta TaxID=2931930 RepID=UPI001CCD9946|nr:hypothetical protein [Kovacikia minuta]UBF26265.1 hypothetical protein K9N68_32965 [Kovacikia minuta CCNUW1]